MIASRRFNGLFIAGLISTLIFGGSLLMSLVELRRGDPGHNWTHRDMRIPLSETRNDLELYIGGELLQKHIERNGLKTIGPDGTDYTVVERDIRVRWNHWAEWRAELTLRAIPAAFLTGLFVACLAIGLYQARRSRRPEPESSAS